MKIAREGKNLKTRERPWQKRQPLTARSMELVPARTGSRRGGKKTRRQPKFQWVPQ